MRIRPRGRGWVTMSSCLLLASAIAACSDDSSGPQPDQSAESLATAMSEGDIGSVKFAGDTDPKHEWKKITSGLGDSTGTYTVGDVREDGDTATATLNATWALEGVDAKWSYDTEVTLERSGEEWRPRWSPEIVAPDLKQGERLSISRTSGDRGRILGAGNQAIVRERPVERIGIDKVHADKAPASARNLARLLDIDVADYVDEVEAAGPDAFVEAIVLRKSDVAELDLARFGRIDGAVRIDDTLALAPTREFAAPILGSVGEATAELIKESDGALVPGDETGLSGLQERYDDRLRGDSGVVVEAVAKSGKEREIHTSKPKPGSDLRTTLDISAQRAAEKALSGIDSPSGLVAIEPSTGNILAAASGPGSDGYSTATIGQYPPGSTFKVVTALAMLRNGYSPGDTLECARRINVNGKSFKNYDDYPDSALGSIAFRRAIAESCNTALIGEQAKVSQQDLADAAASLGLGEDHDTGFSSYFGSVPAKAQETEHAASMIGQGRVQASPLAMAIVASSVVDGSTVVPTLVASHEAEKPTPSVELKQREAGVLQELMRGVVRDGTASFLGDVPGGPVGAKTGTAEYGDGSRTHAWMIATRGDLALAAFVEEGKSGSTTAGPILEQFLRSYSR